MLKKLLLGFAALFFIMIGAGILTMGYFFNHPVSIFNAFQSVTSKLTEGEKYEESEEYFLQGIQTLDIQSDQSNIEIIPVKSPTLKVVLTGKVPHFEKGPFLTQSGDPNHLILAIHEPMASQWIHININGHKSNLSTESGLTAKIFLPTQFLGELNIETNKGNVNFKTSKGKYYEFDLESETGNVENKAGGELTEIINPDEVGKVRISTASGNILVIPE